MTEPRWPAVFLFVSGAVLGACAAVLACVLTGCVAEPIPRNVACEEQATAWCEALADRCPTVLAPDCGPHYRRLCGEDPATVDPDAQGQCLDEIAIGDLHCTGTSARHFDACTTTWCGPVSRRGC